MVLRRDREIKMNRNATFLGIMFGPFFRWWWATITGVATVGGWFLFPASVYILTRIWICFLILFFFALMFLTISATYQGYRLFKNSYSKITLRSIQRCDDFGGDHIFLFVGNYNTEIGSLFEVYRNLADVEVCIAIVEVVHIKDDRTVQAKPIWFSPGQKRDLQGGIIGITSLTVRPIIKKENIERWFSER